MSQGLKEIVEDLKAEQLLLQQLIYRNHNQHSSSQLFSYLKNTARVLKLITPERINAATGRCELALRSSGQAKLSQIDISEIADTHVLLFAVVNMLAEAMCFTLKSSDLVRILLGKKLFLPLYTMLLAISSRLFCCLSELHKHFYVQCNALTSQLQVRILYYFVLFVFHIIHRHNLSIQHISLLNPRLAKQITTHLANPEAKYSAQVEKILLRMTPVSDSSTADGVDSHAAGTAAKSEKSLKENRNISTNSFVSQSSQGGSNTMDDREETPNLASEVTPYEESDREDAGLLIGASVATQGSTLCTLTPSTSSSNLASSAASKTPIRATLTPSAASCVVEKNTEVEDRTDFDSLFASASASETPAKKKQKTETLVKSKSNNDLISVKYKDSKSEGEKEKKGKEKNGKNCTKEKKNKEKGGTKRKNESTDDIDDIFGF